MEEIGIELLNCYGRNQERLGTFLEPNIDFCDMKYAIETLRCFENILIFPYQNKLKVSGMVSEIDFSYKEKEQFLQTYNNIKLQEILEKEQIEKYFSENPMLKDMILEYNSKEYEDFDENQNKIEKNCLPKNLQLFVDKINDFFDVTSTAFNKEDSYLIVIDIDRLSLNSIELNNFIEILDTMQYKDNLLGITPNFDFDDDDNDNCTGIKIFIEIDKSHFPSKNSGEKSIAN